MPDVTCGRCGRTDAYAEEVDDGTDPRTPSYRAGRAIWLIECACTPDGYYRLQGDPPIDVTPVPRVDWGVDRSLEAEPEVHGDWPF
ncbi:MAG TPA: hypothetical protein VJP59_05935 [Gemmatimonadota bacterium]|nr:hypothetical protein [Gemmatimonadota bacterium]